MDGRGLLPAIRHRRSYAADTLQNTEIRYYPVITVGSLNANDLGSVTLHGSIDFGSFQIGSGDIGQGQIITNLLAAGAVVASKIAAGTITGNLIKAGAITTSKIEVGTITGALIKVAAITTSKIAAGTIDGSLIKAGAITTSKITSGTITGELIKAGAISASKVTTGTLLTLSGQIAQAIIQNSHIGSLSANKITAGTINASFIRAGTLLTSNFSFVLGGSINFSSYPIGSTAVKNNNIISQHILAGAIVTSKITAGTITGELIKSGAISAGKITAGTLITTSAQISLGIIQNSHIGSLSANKITAGSISANYIKAGTFIGGNFIVGTQGVIKSSDYIAGQKGFRLDAYHGLEMNAGTLPNRVFQYAYIYGSYIETNCPTSGTTVSTSFKKLKSVKISRGGSLHLFAFFGNITGEWLFRRNGSTVLDTTGRGSVYDAGGGFRGPGWGTTGDGLGSTSTFKGRHIEIPGWRGGDTVELWARHRTGLTNTRVGSFQLKTGAPTTPQEDPAF